MSVTVVGSIAFDAVKTPWGQRDRLLGGSAVHFSLSASFLADVRVVGPVGDDFGEAEYDVLRARGVNVDDVEHVAGGKTFFWSGEYEYDLNTRHTHDTQLNVFADWKPKLSGASRAADVVFLANIQPDLQREVREQCADARVVGLDSMNLWIETARDSLVRTIEVVDLLVVNDAELRQLTQKPNLVQAAREVMGWGPTAVVVKQGEYGASLYTAERFFSLPAYPLETVVDPTGAGDSFAGGLLAYVAAYPDEGLSDELLRRAMAYGTALASFNVEEFGTERVQRLSGDEVRERVAELHAITNWVDLPVEQRA
jgi:sugar/nucleoside kinase (ribokinase family)